MKSWEIKDIKSFMNKMLLTDCFDDFLLEEGDLHSSMRMTFDGHLESGYYSEEELTEKSEKGDCICFKEVRHIILEAIKGKNTPDYFKFVYKANNMLKGDIAREAEFPVDDIGGLYINVTYRAGSLQIVDGTSLKIFTMDKSIDKIWDQWIQNFLNKNEFEWNLL